MPAAKKQEFKAKVEETPEKIPLVDEKVEEVEEKADEKEEVPQVAPEQALSEKTTAALSERPLEEEVPLEKKKKRLFSIGIIIFLLIFGLTGWTLYLTSRFNPETEIKTETTSEVTPTPQEENQLTKEEISLEILNGSGVSGLAAKAAKTFEDLGYKVVKTGNSERVEANMLYVDARLEDRLDILLEDVEAQLKISSISGELTASTASARLVIGKE